MAIRKVMQYCTKLMSTWSHPVVLTHQFVTDIRGARHINGNDIKTYSSLVLAWPKFVFMPRTAWVDPSRSGVLHTFVHGMLNNDYHFSGTCTKTTLPYRKSSVTKHVRLCCSAGRGLQVRVTGLTLKSDTNHRSDRSWVPQSSTAAICKHRHFEYYY